MKNLAIVGATGSTGKEVLHLAIEAGYNVTVLVRDPSKVSFPNYVKIVKADVTDLESLIIALEGMDSVISCFGPSNHREVGTLMSNGMTNIVKACESNQVDRFVFMSGCLQTDFRELSLLAKLIIPLLRLYFRKSYLDKMIGEQSIKNSSINWTIIRAPGLNNSTPLGTYKAAAKQRVYFELMSYTDCARCLIDAVEKKKWPKEIVNLGKL